METQLEVKSQRINLGSGNMNFSDATLRKFNYVIGSLFIVVTIYFFVNTLDKGPGFLGKHTTSIIYLSLGILYLFKAQIELSTKSKYAAHFIISENGIKIKTGVFKKSQFINWKEVKEIEFGPYQVGIKDKAGFQYFRYKTRKETSIELKNAIEEVAKQKEIGVIHV